MTNSPESTNAIDLSEDQVSTELISALEDNKNNKFKRVVMAALSAIPWIGGIISGYAAFNTENEQGHINDLWIEWTQEHKERMQKFAHAIVDIKSKIDSNNPETQQRIESPDYLALVRKGFATWDKADTDQKRKLVQNLLSHAGATRICSDDVVRLFVDWIEKYHEIHFMVIRVIYKNSDKGIGRGDIWSEVSGARVREDSAEADLFKLLIRDMSTGGIIRQHRETTIHGEYRKKTTRRSVARNTLKSAFDNSDLYELTELGKQFVHYTMNEVVPRISDSNRPVNK